MSSATRHTVPLENATLHGSFSRDHPPARTVRSGDAVEFTTLDGDWLLNLRKGPPVAHGDEWPGRRPVVDAGHALSGPVCVVGAAPGSVLAVRIVELRTATWGWSRAGGRGVRHDRLLGVDDGDEHYLGWSLDTTTQTATSHDGHTVAMRPFMGVIGVAPAEPGVHSTHPPRATGGNIDCKELVPGSTLYLPVAVDGALLSVGDGHAAQGDGEVGSTAIECGMESVVVELAVVPDVRLTTPRARTPDAWITFGFAESVDDAVYEALSDMTALVQDLFGFERKEALNLCSQTVDLRVTQIVNGVLGVHAALPHGAIRPKVEVDPAAWWSRVPAAADPVRPVKDID
ncbi:acetamidase/formamidase family protein [Dactylosporangium sp. NPDC000521]|uniref:acetamidase/formamidase family protein n=1 Tax=Dactylosporangium sp. NPDC000521 TaxID=3363975 RepID=UPI0036C8DB27